jgi:lysophospholipase L1-like esterase
MSTICVFGDSTAWGAWDTEKGGWINRLWLLFAEKREDAIYNLSVDGGTTETILERFESEAKIREADALIFQSGGNDAAYEHEAGNFLVPLDKFEENVEEIIKRAKKITDRIVFISFKNVDEARTKPISWRDIYYTNENIKRYNDAMEDICVKNNVSFLSIFGLLSNGDLDDGLHPNTEGHKKIFEKVKDFLIQNRIITI